ncbi:MAG: hypothetical protein QM731_12720 [Chitinophagaceae bacterium]
MYTLTRSEHRGESKAVANNMPPAQHTKGVGTAQLKVNKALQSSNNLQPVVQRVVDKGLPRGTRVLPNLPMISDRKGIILRETSFGYEVRLVPGPRMIIRFAGLDLDTNDTTLAEITPEIAGPSRGATTRRVVPVTKARATSSRDIGHLSALAESSGDEEEVAVAEKERPEAGKHFRWPEALVDSIEALPKGQKIKGNDVNYQYDKAGALSYQPAEGREMRKKESLISRGAWKSEEARKNYLLSVDGGVLKDAEGRSMSGAIQYVLSEDWKLYGQEAEALGAEKDKYGRSSDVHTRYLAGGPARSAGWIVAAGGKITRVGNDSGHYGPHMFMMYQLLVLLRDGGVDLSDVIFHEEAEGQAYNALAMYTWMKGGAKKGEMPAGKKSKGM